MLKERRRNLLSDRQKLHHVHVDVHVRHQSKVWTLDKEKTLDQKYVSTLLTGSFYIYKADIGH